MNNPNMLLKYAELNAEDRRTKEVLNVLENTHTETFTHSIQVAFIVANFIERNKSDFTEKEAEELITSAFLHDIGKIDIPVQLLDKVDPLTEREYKTIQKHSVMGSKILKKMGFDSRICYLVMYHHFRHNPKSYPNKLPFNLKHDERFLYHLEILSIADIFSAIVQERHYHNARSVEYALNEIENEYFNIETYIKFKKLVENSGQMLISGYSEFLSK